MQKTVNEILTEPVNFATELRGTDALVAGQPAATSINLGTGASSTTTIVDQVTLSGNTVLVRVKNGVVGETHRITVNSGVTTQGNRYERVFDLEITARPKVDRLLTTIDKVKVHLAIDASDTSEDEQVRQLIGWASVYVQSRTKRTFTLEQYVEDIEISDEHNPTKLRVSEFPVTRVERILILDLDGTRTVADITDQTLYKWRFDPNGWLAFTDGNRFGVFPQLNRITYWAGYADIPEDIQGAVTRLAAVFKRAIGKEGVQSEKIGDYAYRLTGFEDFPTGMRRELTDPWIEGVIARYRAEDL